MAQDAVEIRLVEVVHGAEQLEVTVEKVSGGNLRYTLQHSPDLSADSWVKQGNATLTVLDPLRVKLSLPVDGASAGYVRVIAGPAETILLPVVINEVMTNNETIFTDGDGDFPDWIELYNHGETPADLSGHHLSDKDSNLDKWVFPAGTILEPGEHLIVFASGKVGDEIPAGELHAAFKLSNGSEPIILSDPDSIIVDRLDPGPLTPDTTVGRARHDLQTFYLFGSAIATPGEANQEFGAGAPNPFIQAPIFRVRGGVFAGPVTLELVGPTEGSVVRYTIDGSEPNISSTLSEAPIEISETTVIRAMVVGSSGSRIVTHTYFVGTDHELPVISMATDPDNFEFTAGYLYGFGDHMFTNGGNIIGNFPYSASNAWKRNREVEASFEVYEPEGGEKLRIDVGLKIFGGWGSRGYPQKSMALFARSEYGYGKIRHPFFPNKTVDAFESIVLRNSGNDNQSTWLTYPRPPINEFGTPASHGSYFVNGNFTMFRDAMMQSLVEGTGLDTQGYRPAVLYVNGDYWGIYNIREKFSEHYVESTHDVPSDDIDLIEGYGSANSGSSSTYNQMRNFIQSRSMNNRADYQTVQDLYLNIDNFIDYHLAVIYGQNFDIGNIKCWRQRSGEEGQFHWMLYDQDYSFNLWKPDVYIPAMRRDYSDYDNMFEFYTNSAGSGTGWPNSGGRTLLLREMLESDEFENRFVQRCADLLNTLFESERVLARIDTMAGVIRPEMGRHLSRWSWEGIQSRGFGIPHKEEDEPLTVAHWESNVESMREFARERPDKLRQDLIDHFNLPNGTAAVTIASSDLSKGTVQINTIGLDDSPWTGQYFRDFPPTLTAKPKEGVSFVRWSGGSTSTSPTIELSLEGATVSVTAIFE
ncbi:MAG: hypothetical protein ACJAQT_003033 [Akkermansiaceae bacterium]|jgi:hypothetical protein